eukprot:5212508-Amphidinium_carterae.1
MKSASCALLAPFRHETKLSTKSTNWYGVRPRQASDQHETQRTSGSTPAKASHQRPLVSPSHVQVLRALCDRCRLKKHFAAPPPNLQCTKTTKEATT